MYEFRDFVHSQWRPPYGQRIHHSLEEFAAAREQFSYLVNRLQSEEMGRMEHGEVEATTSPVPAGD